MIIVKALKLGFYGGKRRYPGDEFEIADKRELGRWMQVIDDGVLRLKKPKVKAGTENGSE